MKISKWILPVIVVSQFCGTSLWFAGNGVMSDLVRNFNLGDNALSYLTSAVQFGFIIGTLFFALFTIADRFPPSKVFFINAVLGSLCNLGAILENNDFLSLLALRFLTGIFLAGIYPIGMKVATDYFEKGLGKSLSFLVGALVLGTAFPHLLNGFDGVISWKMVLLATSGLAVLGGLLMLFLVPSGPYRKSSQELDLATIFKVFKNHDFRAAAIGYFGHMWELYAFWAFVPVMLATYAMLNPGTQLNIPLLSFLIIGIGGLTCVIGGYLAQIFGTKKTATFALLLSCICCLFSPLFFLVNSSQIFIVFLMIWSTVVISDSPLFSTLISNNTVAESKGTALTIVNSIGFAITIISIQLLAYLKNIMNPTLIYTVLAFGPIIGLSALYRNSKKQLK